MNISLLQSHLTNSFNTVIAIANGADYTIDGLAGPAVGYWPIDLLTAAIQGRIKLTCTPLPTEIINPKSSIINP